MEYLNIKKDMSAVMSQDKVATKTELINSFEDFINDSDYKVVAWINKKRAPYELMISNGEKKIHLFVYLKNITGAGWESKPHMKRVQVSNVRKVSIDSYVETSVRQSFMILGYYNFDDNPIMAAWDAYRYIRHETMRSCYVSVDTLLRGYSNGYFVGTDSSQKIWLFDSYHFDKFIDDYISYQSE